ncbi:MAG TPA: glycosyltransferase family 4 protein [Gemmatimonadales bacterium]
MTATRPTELVRADLYFCWWWTWAFVPLTLAHLLGRPSLVTGVFDEWMFDERPLIQRILLRFALRFADRNIFISELERRIVPERFAVNNPGYSPCIVDTARYRPAPLVQREGFLLTVAWLAAENASRKGILELIRALPLILARHPNVRWVHCGEHGTGAQAVHAEIEACGVGHAVEFRGVVTADEKIALMQSCGAYVQPSRFEGFGLAVLEAMACGAPVATSRGGALPEVVGDAGMLFDDLAPETIASAVSRLLADPISAAALGARARQRAEREFSFARRRADLEQAIAGALATTR